MSQKVHKAEFTLRLDFTDLVARKVIVVPSIGPHDDAILLLVDPDANNVPFGRDDRGGPSFPRYAVDHPYPATVLHCLDGSMVVTNLASISAAVPLIQPLADGEILIVSSLCQIRNGIHDANASIYDAKGTLSRRMTLGDGIEDVQVSNDNRFWVSYSDAGVYGDDLSFGSNGLTCFDPTGKPIWQYQPPDGFGTIDHCYALNVADNGVWAYYYTDFPIVKISNEFDVCGWRNTYTGASTIAADDQRILLWGGYSRAHSRCVLQTIVENTLISQTKLQLSLPGGKTLDALKVIGRGPSLHVFDGPKWYQFDLADFRL